MITGVGFLPRMPEQQFIGEFIAKSLQGWRLVSLAMYGDLLEPYYAGIWWYPRPEGTWQDVALDLDPSNLIPTVDQERINRGIYPTIITATQQSEASIADEIRYAVVFDKPTTPPPTPTISTLALYETLNTLCVSSVITSVDVVNYQWGYRFPAILYPFPATRLANAMEQTILFDGGGLADFEADDRTKAMRRGWVRPEAVLPAPFPGPLPGESFPEEFAPGSESERRIYSLWHDDTFEEWPSNLADGSFTGGVVTLGPFHPNAANEAYASAPAGYFPYRVFASGSGSDERMCLLFSKREAPLPRKRIVRTPGKIKKSVLKDFPAGGPFFSSYRSGSPELDRQLAAIGWRAAAAPARSPRPLTGPRSSARPRPEAIIGRGLGSNLGLALPPDGEVYLAQGSGTGLQSEAVLDAPVFSKPSPYEALDDYVFSIMAEMGARAAQLAVTRNGVLVLVRAYTYAEEGYPETRGTTIFGLGSLSKPLTGMAVVGLFAPNGDPAVLTNTTLDVALGVSAQDPTVAANLSSATLEQILKHQAGWPRDFDEAEVGVVARGIGPPALPGDTLTYLRQTATTPAGMMAPGPSQYSGATLRALSDRIGEISYAVGTGWQYEDAMCKLWHGGDNYLDFKKRAHLSKQTPEACLAAGHAPRHAYAPGLGWAYPYTEQSIGLRIASPVAYHENLRWSAGAGAWCMSMPTLCRIMCSMDPLSSVRKFLRPAAVDLVWKGVPGDPNPSAALWTRKITMAGTTWDPFQGVIPVTRTRFIHNGGARSISAVASLDRFSHFSKKSTCVAFAVNIGTRAMGDDEIDKIVSEVEKIELSEGWPSGDLFGALGLL